MKNINTNKLFKRTSASLLVLSALLTGCSEKSMESHLADARGFVAQQQLDAAVVEYKSAIQKAPDAAEPRFELGKLYLQGGNFIAAEKELSKAMELGFEPGEVIPLLSLAYQQSGAENALANVDYRAPGMTVIESAEVGFYKLQALAQLGQTAEAQALLADLKTLDTSSVYRGLIDSYEFVLANDMAGAISASEQLREQSPSNKDVLQQLAKLYLQNNEPQKATQVYSDYVSAYPNDVTSKFAYAALLVEQRDLDKAEPIVNELIKLNESHPLLNTFKGIIESAKGNYAKALEHLEVAVQNGRNDQVVRLVAGFSAYQIQDFEAAQRHLVMVASSLPDNHPGLRMLADSMLQLGENEEALKVLTRVKGEQDNDAALFSKASYQLLREGNVQGAKQMVEKSEVVSTTAEDLSRLGVLQLSLNDVDGLVNLEQAVDKAPQSATTQSTLLRAYIATDQLDKAKEAAKQWNSTSPAAAMPLVYLASIAIVENDFEQAHRYLNDADALDSAGNEVTYTRAKLLIAEDKKADAQTLIKAFIKDNPSDIEALTMWFALATETGEVKTVLSHAQTQLDKAPQNINLRVMLGRFYALNQQADKTLALLSEVEGDGASPMSFWNLKGQVLIASNNITDTNAFFDRWLSFYPQDKNAVLGKLLILDTQRQFSEGLALTNKTLEKRSDAQLNLLKAYFHSRLGEVAPAWKIVNESSEEIKALPFVRGIMARLYMAEGKAAEALPHALATYEETQNSDNLLLLVAAYDAAGERDKAFTTLETHVNKYDTDMRAAMLLAERQIQQDRSAASASYEKILKTMPDNFVVLNNLAYLALEDKKLVQAEKLAKRAVAIQPDNTDAVDTLAQVLVAKGDKAAALTLYEKIANNPIGNDEVYLNHVELLLDMGNATLAKRRLSSREFTAEASKARVDALKAKYSI